jgi:DNA-binding transcriptional regulator GbsR (MarR family)
MKGHLVTGAAGAERGSITAWESLVIEAVGNVIEFWGFKATQGKVWALLYLLGRPLNAAELQRMLGLSKGAISQVTRELEQWGVVERVRRPGVESWLFEAETDLMRMVVRVISDREAKFVARVEADLAEAERLARADRGAAKDELERIVRIRALARYTGIAIEGFLKTARLDVKSLSGVLKGSALRLVRRMKP